MFFDQISSCGPQGFSVFWSVLSLVCFFVFRVVTVCDHPPNAYAFGSSSNKTALRNIIVITIVLHGLCVGNHNGCHSIHCAPSE